MRKEMEEKAAGGGRVMGGCAGAGGAIKLPGVSFSDAQIRSISKITIAASGSSRHAGMVGEFMLERMTGLPVEVDFASQYCYRSPVVEPHELAIFLSQSGTTIDTITALRVARRKGAKSLAICNVAETPLTQNADTTLLTHAGEEVAVAATKSFTTQLTALFLLSAFIAQAHAKSSPATRAAVAGTAALPRHLQEALGMYQESRKFAAQLYRYNDFIYVGRDLDYPIASWRKLEKSSSIFQL